jgi:hypothetical protein
MAEQFAVYGLRLEVPEDWRFEFNKKNRKERGDVAFHTPKKNIFFVSWGRLDEALKAFHTLEKQREKSIGRIKGNPNVGKVDVELAGTERIGGHDALLSRVSVHGRRGFMGRGTADRDVWSLHLHCPTSARYYVLYMEVKVPEEYPDQREMFLTVAKSLNCHGAS